MIPEAVVTVNGVDLSCETGYGVQIHHGRDDPTAQPDPATAQLTMYAQDETLLAKLPINGLITVDAKFPDTSITRRFTGIITDVDMTWETIEYGIVRVLAASGVSILGRTFIGDTPWPQEDDGDRATRILSVVATVPYQSNFSSGVDGWTTQNGATMVWNTYTPGARPPWQELLITWHGADFEACSKNITGLLPGGAYTATAQVRPSTGGIGIVQGGVALGSNVPPNPALVGTQTISVNGRADSSGNFFISFWPYSKAVSTGKTAAVVNVTLTAQHQVPQGQIDPGTVQILARDVDKKPCLTLLQELANDAGGIAWHTRDGAICYADAEHRRGEPSALTLDCSQILMAPQWSKTTQGVVNDTTVSYGVPVSGSEQPTVSAQDNNSIASFGRLAVSQSTQLATSSDASQRAQETIVRGANPVWNMPVIPIDLADSYVDEAQTRRLLLLEMNALIAVTGLPAQGPYVSRQLWIEGWDEGIAASNGVGSWTLDFAVSDYCRTAPAPRWDDIAATYTWDTIPDIKWDEAQCMGPQPPSGTWNDIAASLRWDDVTASITWDTWS